MLLYPSTWGLHPTYYALVANGFSMMFFGSILLTVPKMLLVTAGYNRTLDAQLVMMHRITGYGLIRHCRSEAVRS